MVQTLWHYSHSSFDIIFVFELFVPSLFALELVSDDNIAVSDDAMDASTGDSEFDSLALEFALLPLLLITFDASDKMDSEDVDKDFPLDDVVLVADFVVAVVVADTDVEVVALELD